MDEWEEGSWGGWGNTEFQVAMRSDTEGLDEGSLLSALKMLSLKASVPRHPAQPRYPSTTGKVHLGNKSAEKTG